jgi:AcrR family transcriptional regulator
VSERAPVPWSRALAGRATRERGRRTLTALLDAGVAEFSAYGYHGARVARVATRAGTSHGTFYLYFTGKDDLLIAVYDDIAAETHDVLAAMPTIEAGADGLAALSAWVRAVCVNFQDNAAIRGALLDAFNEAADQRVATMALRWMSRSTAVFADRIRATRTTGLDPDLAAVCIWNLLDGANRSVSRGELVVSLDELVAGLAEFIQRSVLGYHPTARRPGAAARADGRRSAAPTP